MSCDSCTGRMHVNVPRFRDNAWEMIEDAVSVEVPIHISWQDPVSVQNGIVRLWAWPENPAPLALGHVLLDVCPDEYGLHRYATVIAAGNRHYSVTVGNRKTEEIPSPPASLCADGLFKAMHAFIAAGGQWDGTGCFHRAGVFDPTSERMLARAEDIGRHNCLDRLAGWSVINNIPLADKVLLTSARITASLCAKALQAGFRILASRSAVTTASIEQAAAHGATLIGFARTDEQRFTVFTDDLGRLSHMQGE